MRKNEITIPIEKFNGGVVRLVDEARLQLDQAKEAQNLIQVQDGLYKPRWGRDYYGADLTTNIDGATEYVVSRSSRELIVITNGVLKYSTDNGNTWNTQTGASFTAGTTCYFLQINQYLYITNGTDSLARYTSNGSSRSLTTYSAINAPGSLSGTATSTITGTGYTYWAQVTALNDIGETVGSTEASCTVTKKRDLWTSTTDGITWSWGSVVGANRYQLYISDEQGDQALLTSTTSTTFLDNGTLTINQYVTPPLSNTTSAPKFKDMIVSGNRIWATNDPNNPYMVYFSGVGTFIGVFSDFYGGGWINLEKGGREFPIKAVHYMTGQGEGRATVLCSTPEGRGAVWQITISTATVGDTSFSVPSASKVVGSFGTDAMLSVVSDANNIWFYNRRGIFNLGPEKQYFGILRTNEQSSRIRPYIRGLIGSQISKVAAYYYDAKLFFSVPTSSVGNSATIIYDTERLNWIVDWTFGVQRFFEYTDSNNVTHLLYVPVSGTQLVEISENIQGDFGAAFDTIYTSGRWQVSKLFKDFSKINKVYLKLGSPRGSINFEVKGTQRNKPYSTLATKTITPTYSLTGMGWDLMGNVQMGSTEGTPTSFSDTADIRYVKIRKKIRDIQFRITTSSVDADYTLLGFILEGRATKTRPPSSWKVS